MRDKRDKREEIVEKIYKAHCYFKACGLIKNSFDNLLKKFDIRTRMYKGETIYMMNEMTPSMDVARQIYERNRIMKSEVEHALKAKRIQEQECAEDKTEAPAPAEEQMLKFSEGMTLNEYQSAAMKTCMPTCENYEYMLLNLVGEVGELCGKMAKHIRKGEAELTYDGIRLYLGAEQMELLKKELGDVMWQTAGVATMMGCKLEDIARQNLEKLASRADRGVIDGDGDVR